VQRHRPVVGAGPLGYQYLPSLGGLTDPGRDVHVDTEVVPADPSRAAEMKAGSQPGGMLPNLDPVHRLLGLERRPHRVPGVAEHLDPSPSRFTRLPPAGGDRLVLGGGA
jgi:hypothetical protein